MQNTKCFYKNRAALFSAALLCCLAAACNDGLGKAGGGTWADAGLLTITVSGGAPNTPRTLFAETPFSKYVISFTPMEPLGPEAATADLTLSEAGQFTVALIPGAWRISATAYITDGGADYAAAAGEAQVTIVAGQSASAEITVVAPVTGAAQTGSFKFSIHAQAALEYTILLTKPEDNYEYYADFGAGSFDSSSMAFASGVYLLTVSASLSGKTITRTGIVYIYPHAVTNAVYVFPQTDFGVSSTLSGTVNVTVNAGPPASALIYAYSDASLQTQIGSAPVNLTSGAWSMSVAAFNGSPVVYFKVQADVNGAGSYFSTAAGSIQTPVEDKANISLGTVVVTGDAGLGLVTVEDEDDITLQSGYTAPISQTAGEYFTVGAKEGGALLADNPPGRGIWWYVDGARVTALDNKGTVTVNAVDYAAGIHYLTVMVWKDGVPYTPAGDLRFRVTE